jgi:hypothetical protein
MNPKKLLFIFLQILLNSALIVAAYWIYVNIALKFSYYTVLPQHFAEIFLVLALLVLLPLLSLKRFGVLKWFNFGLSALIAVGLFYLFIFLNQKLAPEKYQRRFPVEHVETMSDVLELEVYIYEKSGRVSFICPKSDCQRTDTVLVTIHRGVFGFPIVSDKIDESKKEGC